MSSIINYNDNGIWKGIPALRGPKGDKGDPGDGSNAYTKPESDAKFATKAEVTENYTLLSVFNALVARVVALENGSVVPTPPDEPSERPIVPSGTWQLKTTTDKRYVILGTDDDNNGNAWYFRLLRTYGFPYTMNVEAENAQIAKALGSDKDEEFFTADDAPSLFPNGVDVVTLGKYLHDNHLGEVAQHGSSAHTLWDSARLVGDFWNNLYASYTAQGGTKSEEEFRNAIKEALADSDVSQGATYVAASRATLEECFGFYIDSVGIWGGSPIATIDGFEVDLNSIKGGAYDWRADNYVACGSDLKYVMIPNTSPFDIRRTCDMDTEKLKSLIPQIKVGKANEFFLHAPRTDMPHDDLRSTLIAIKEMVDEGSVAVVTRTQYAELGEYVADTEAIASINLSFSKTYYTASDTPSESDFVCNVTYKDGHTSVCNADRILDLSNINVTEPSTYMVMLYYRGFESTTNVEVVSSGASLPSDLIGSGRFYEICKPQGQDYYYLFSMTAVFETGTSVGSNAWYWKISNAKEVYVYTYVSTDMSNWTKIVDGVGATSTNKLSSASLFGEYATSIKAVDTIVSVTQA